MSAFLRNTLTFALIATVVALTGCSKETTKPTTVDRDPLTQEHADDIVQQVAAMMIAPNGGWFTEVQSTVEATQGLQTLIASDVPPYATLRDSTFTVGSMNFEITYNFVDTLGQDHIDWVPGTFQVEGLLRATGSIATNPFNGTYNHNGDFTADFRDSPGNTVEFYGFSEDTSLGFAKSTFRADSSWWFMDMFYDYEGLRISRDLVTNPYPLLGTVDMDIDCFRLNSINLTDIRNHIEAVLTMSFDGTDSALFTIVDDFDPPSGSWQYRVHFMTGAITRVPTAGPALLRVASP